jgi:hypothetical protein
VIAAAHDAAATSDLAALRAVLAGSTADGTLATEAALIATTLEALERLPRPTPPADVVAALVDAAGRAARASALASVRAALDGVAPAGVGAEDALMRTTWQAVERMPRSAPPVDAVQAVLAAAHAAVPSPLREAAALRRAADRPAARETRSFRRFAYLTAAMAFVGFVGVGLWASGGGRQETAEPLAAIEESDPAASTDAPTASIESAVPVEGASPAPAAAFADALGSTDMEA